MSSHHKDKKMGTKKIVSGIEKNNNGLSNKTKNYTKEMVTIVVLTVDQCHIEIQGVPLNQFHN